MRYIYTLMLAIFITACSSNSPSSNPGTPPGSENDPGFTNPGVDTEQPIEKEKGYALDKETGTVYLDGEVLGTIEKVDQNNHKLVSPEGETLAFIEETMGGFRIIINHDNPGAEYRDSYHLVKDESGKWIIDWPNSVIDHSWGVDTDVDGRPAPHKFSDSEKKKHFKDTLKRR